MLLLIFRYLWVAPIIVFLIWFIITAIKGILSDCPTGVQAGCAGILLLTGFFSLLTLSISSLIYFFGDCSVADSILDGMSCSALLIVVFFLIIGLTDE